MRQLPISVQNCNGVSAISLKLNYDNNLLTYVGYQNVNGTLVSDPIIVNSIGSSIIISWISTTPANIGNNVLIELLFNTATGNAYLNWDTQTSGSCSCTAIILGM